jgi:hypothetical protein
MTAAHPVPDRVPVFGQRAFIVGGVGLGLCLLGGLRNPTEFFRSYLLSFLFWAGVATGCLSLLLVQHLTGGRWGLLMRRVLEAGTRTLPFVGLAFIPIALGVSRIYPWAAPNASNDAIIAHKSAYLNPIFFVARAAFYFAVWSAMAYFLSLWSRRLDAGFDRRLDRRLRALSGGGLVVLGLTITFSSIDWAMSLDPHWGSTIYGFLFMVGQVLAAFAFVILVLAATAQEAPFRAVLHRETTHDLGKLLFAFVMLWAYMHLSQFLIIWSANLPEEIPWYLRRTTGGWLYVAWLVIAAHFVAPFLALLSRDLKRNLQWLAAVAGIVFCARFVDLFWLIAPDMGRAHLAVHLTDIPALVGLGGLWLGLFARELAGRPLIPLNQPELELAPEHA